MKQIVPREDIRRAAGRSIICGIHGTGVTAETKELLREVKPLGVILFARNVESPIQVAELNRELKSLRPSDDPLLISVDQEGGRVQRVKSPATEWPPMRTLGETGDPALVKEVMEALGRELRAMHFDVDFAPVLDVDTNPDNPVIGDRSFSRSPRDVGRLGVAAIQGLHAAGIAACGKHFPGHGDTDTDSHLALPRVQHELPRLQEVEWPPFKMAIEAGLQAVMTAHVVVDCLAPDVPATLAPDALRPLRGELGFKGVIVSDDLEMKAVADHYSPADMARLGLTAGVDVFLACDRPDVVMDLYRGIVQSIEKEQISQQRLLESEKRALAWRQAFYKPPGGPELAQHIGSPAHQDLLHRVAAQRAKALS